MSLEGYVWVLARSLGGASGVARGGTQQPASEEASKGPLTFRATLPGRTQGRARGWKSQGGKALSLGGSLTGVCKGPLPLELFKMGGCKATWIGAMIEHSEHSSSHRLHNLWGVEGCVCRVCHGTQSTLGMLLTCDIKKKGIGTRLNPDVLYLPKFNGNIIWAQHRY